jgi:hypothetical protein
MPRKCVNDVDSFCYVCGDYTIKLNRKTITPLIKKIYELYFGCKQVTSINLGLLTLSVPTVQCI